MNLVLIDINLIRQGVWGLVYTATCDCGCKSTRHIAVYRGLEPTKEQANQLIDEDYNQQ